MRKVLPLISVLALFSLLSGYLFSKASLVGRVGINLFYKQYHFLRVWWQAAGIVFLVLMLHLLLQLWIHAKASQKAAKITHSIFLGIGLIGLYFTYLDFQKSVSHRWLGEQFHLGAYLFWMGWILVSLYYLLKRRLINTL